MLGVGDWAQELMPAENAELWLLGFLWCNGLLVVVLFLELARRHYASPAENASVVLRAVVFVPLLLAVTLPYWGLPESAPLLMLAIGQLVTAYVVMMTVLMMDALMPFYDAPMSHKHGGVVGGLLLRSGVVPGVLWLLLGSLALWGGGCLVMKFAGQGIVEQTMNSLGNNSVYSLAETESLAAVQGQVELALPTLNAMLGAFLLSQFYGAALCLLLTDIIMPRLNRLRVLVYGVGSVMLSSVLGTLGMFLPPAVKAYLPFMTMGLCTEPLAEGVMPSTATIMPLLYALIPGLALVLGLVIWRSFRRHG